MEKLKKNIIIAGPCAIEKKENFLEIIDNIYQYVDVIRCGVWKARTSPKDYPGQGYKALKWIEAAQKKYNIPFAIEVGTPKHVELALKHEIKIFWIGARTTSNPFSVQEIANSVKGSNTEIWIKNPIFTDLRLWFGAIERFNSNKIKVIHRGFYNEKHTNYRNPPRWDLLKKFKNMYPRIPIICDPSHITGNRNLIPTICKQAIKKNVDGLMIEVHNNPETALSDQEQQLSPINFIKLMKKLNLK